MTLNSFVICYAATNFNTGPGLAFAFSNPKTKELSRLCIGLVPADVHRCIQSHQVYPEGYHNNSTNCYRQMQQLKEQVIGRNEEKLYRKARELCAWVEC